MTLTKKNDRNFIEGPLFTKILLFILPLMAANLLQVLYNAADMMVVSFSNEPDAVGAIGVTSSLVSLIVNLFIGFATGANVMVARHIGARSDEKVSRTVHTALSMSVIFGVFCTVIGLSVCRPILSVMGAEGKLLDLAVLYTQIYFCGVPFISITNYAIAILRAKGDTKTPLYILAFSGLLNVLLNLMFVLAFDLSVEGVALATALSNVVSAILLLLRLSREESACRFSIRKLCLDRKALGEILYIGLPAGIQSALFSLSNIIIQSSILQVNNAMSPADSAFQPVVKGNAAAANLENFAFTAVNSVHQAAITFTGQNAGAEKYDRVGKVVGYSYLVSMMVAVFFTAVIFLLKDPLLALYGVEQGAKGTLELIAYETAIKRMLIHLLTFPVYAFMDIGSGVARGLRKALSTTAMTLIGTCLLRVVWIFTVFRAIPTLEVIYMSYPLSWGLTGIAQLLLVLFSLRQCRRRAAQAALQ